MDAIERAKIAVAAQGDDVGTHFTDVSKVSGSRGPAQRDVELTRFAAYQGADAAELFRRSAENQVHDLSAHFPGPRKLPDSRNLQADEVPIRRALQSAAQPRSPELVINLSTATR